MRKKWRKKKEITDSELKQLNLEEIEEEMEKLQPEAYPEITFNHSESPINCLLISVFCL